MRRQFLSLPDESGQISKLAKLHYEVDVVLRFEAVDERDDVRVLNALEDVDLGKEVGLELSF